MMLLAMTYLGKSSDRNYLDALYREHYKTLYGLAYSILHDKTAAEDTVTNAMLSLFSKATFLQTLSQEKCSAYLRTTVRNAAYKVYDAQKKKNLTEVLPLNSLLFSLPSAGAAGDPAQVLQKNEEYRAVWEAISELAETDRQALHLKYAAGLTAWEIAEMLNAPSEAAIQTRLSRARNKVLLLLERRGWLHD